MSAVGTRRGSRYKPGRKLTATRKRQLLARRTALSICTICECSRRQRDACGAGLVWRIVGRAIVGTAHAGGKKGCACRAVARHAVACKVCGICAERKKKLRAKNEAAGYLSLRAIPDAWPEVLRELSSGGGSQYQRRSAGLNSTTCSVTRYM